MVIPRTRGGWSPQHLVAIIVALWLGQLTAEAVFAVEAPDRAAPAAHDDSHSPDEPGAADLLAKNRALTFAFVMLGCIIVGGAMLLALVVIWGNRTRRLAQSPLPPIARRDELWFLKPKKEAADGTGGDAPSDPDQETGPEE